MTSNSLFPPDYQLIQKIIASLPFPHEQAGTAVAIPGSQKPGYSAVYRNKASQDQLYSSLHPSLTTLTDVFDYAVATYPNEPCLGARVWDAQAQAIAQVYTWQTYLEVSRRQTNLGAGMIHVVNQNRVVPTSTFIPALFSANTVEWVLTDLACCKYGLTNTALYPSLGPDASSHILRTTESPIVVCSADKLAYMIALKRSQGLENFTVLVSQTAIEASLEWLQLRLDALSAGLKLYTLAEVEEIGQAHPHAQVHTAPSDVYTISFTSGTTGLPKGVKVSHEQMAANLAFSGVAMPSTKRGAQMCFLPLPHIYQRCMMGLSYVLGHAIGFPQSASPLTLVDDLKVLKPVVLASVPRMYSKMESAIKGATTGAEKEFTRNVSSHIIGKRTKWMNDSNFYGSHWLYDNMLTKKLRRGFGLENAKFVVSGLAPISPDTQKFFKAALNIGFMSGYGMTETASGVCVSDAFDNDFTSSGPVGVACEVRLRDVPEMGYASTDEGGARGELLMRGPQVFLGYYKNPEETAKVFDEDGWFLSGDIASIDPVYGRITIIDRVKNHLKLSQGEYITPERIESLFISGCPFITQLYVHGDSLELFLVAVVGYDPVVMSGFIKKHFGIEETDPARLAELLTQERIKRGMVQVINLSVPPGVLQGYEKIHNVHFAVEPMTVELGLVTPTMKVKRPNCGKHFRDIIAAMYAEGSLIKKEKL